jgi:hypothetical protein
VHRFFDDGLLWLHFEQPVDTYEYRASMPNYPQQANYARFVVAAAGATPFAGDATSLARALANTAAIAGAVNTGRARPYSGLCGSSGPMQVRHAVHPHALTTTDATQNGNGVLSYTQTGTNALVLFDEAFDPNWAPWCPHAPARLRALRDQVRA